MAGLTLLHLDLDLFSASLTLLSVPGKKRHLPPKTQALIAIIVDSASTLLHRPGIRVHVAEALLEAPRLRRSWR